ncbi:ComEC/Rec2 family competence protein [Modestobacter excelsi]|uniref:ComEC/Rec2 family competence protein n=1 Tax=Modestobacter excelsi TaxID=2213161 RepID=UPI001FEC6616|nr:ComEC/Rec2 family competence protein [Modestobacter excelsi]
MPDRRARPRVQRVRTQQRWSWVDLRLVPPAVTVWVGTLAARGLPAGPLLGVAGGAAAAAVLLLRTSRNRSGAAAAVVVGCLAALTVVGAVAAVRAQGRTASPLPGLAAREAVVPVVVELDEDPRPLAGAGEPRVLVPATATEVDGRRTRGNPVLVFGPADQWTGLLPGQSVRLRVAVRTAEPGDDVLAVLSARSAPTPLAGPGPVQTAAGALRSGLARSAARTLPDRPAGLLPALVVGDTTGMDPALTAEFRRAGLSHLTAVSGFNVG